MIAAGKLKINAKDTTLTCTSPLEPSEQQLLRATLAGAKTAAERIVELCEQARLTDLRLWNADEVRKGMTRNYVARWMGNWFRPNNLLLYWFTAYNRADIMAQTFQNNLYDRGGSARLPTDLPGHQSAAAVSHHQLDQHHGAGD